MANQMIALQARAPQAPDLGRITAQYGNMMVNMANMDKMRMERAAAQNIRNIMSAPDFDPTNAASLNKLIQLGPAGVNAAQEVMQAQKIGLDISGLKQDQAIKQQQQAVKRVETVGAGLIGLLRDPSDSTLAQAAQTFAAVGMDPKEYQGVLEQVSKIADPNGRKQYVLEFIAQTPNAQAALKYVMPDVKSEKIGDAQVFIDNNANSPTFGAELFRITASPEPVKLNQQVVDNTLYNVNPITGVAQEAVIGDATQGLVQGPRTYARTDTGVMSPYSVATPRVGTETTAAFVPQTSLPGSPPAPARGAPVRRDVGDIFNRMVGVESGGRQFSAPGRPLTSPKGAIGIAQVMPGTAPEAAKLAGLPYDENRYRNDAQYNRALGKAYFAKQLADFGNERLAVAAYNAGPGAVRRALQKGGPDGWINYVPRETQKYVEDVFGGRGNVRASAGGAQPTDAPKTVTEAATEKAFKKILPIIGYDPKTGKDRVSDLIAASTSGAAEMLGSEVVGAFGKATPGRVALGELSAIAENMTFEKLRGKLGAQISDADVRLIARTMADIANGKTPANQRAAAWKNVVLPLLLRGANVEAPKSVAPPASTRPKPTPADVQAVRRNRNSREWTEGFRRQFGDAALRSALGGR